MLMVHTQSNQPFAKAVGDYAHSKSHSGCTPSTGGHKLGVEQDKGRGQLDADPASWDSVFYYANVLTQCPGCEKFPPKKYLDIYYKPEDTHLFSSFDRIPRDHSPSLGHPCKMSVKCPPVSTQWQRSSFSPWVRSPSVQVITWDRREPKAGQVRALVLLHCSLWDLYWFLCSCYSSCCNTQLTSVLRCLCHDLTDKVHLT